MYELWYYLILYTCRRKSRTQKDRAHTLVWAWIAIWTWMRYSDMAVVFKGPKICMHVRTALYNTHLAVCIIIERLPDRGCNDSNNKIIIVKHDCTRWISMIKNTFSLDLKTFYVHTYPPRVPVENPFFGIFLLSPNVCALLYFRFASSRLSFPSEWRPERETNTTTPEGAGNNGTNTCLFFHYIFIHGTT